MDGWIQLQILALAFVLAAGGWFEIFFFQTLPLFLPAL